MGHVQNETQMLLQEILKSDHQLLETLCLSKYHMFWLSYESFSILCDVFCHKSVIFS